ncbi:uncharacterized protein LOC122052825 isoform X1 [Zingiber officinale]|uniref:uncharacterized protein LOC122052825 isoform X1 n=1 Tax=Zingiber officinale TaxID=94328 RepID=UPI001C4DA39D|nr:uncharacterized protein LOC122052825 isoform X1 [Zingiber officinale]XP_042470476.1 uncharacterized protein LOC122052825 isoform X1 [Zingiber officinale]XP_042470478.1 uncharacterized protein LOC122052825 isoform X1 [Zingiber officinale]XP_042470479.1 uncharacterized protein LOC122052825 isoform X1 [Zingiber officinale]XP_042470480.1 uncharacterized protein LOC122052825 isoform X1 [Zingiber officinale]XP_042470481.1 uncharacterized protein LOC122052825 isoform X1 [Zingiber officinale]
MFLFMDEQMRVHQPSSVLASRLMFPNSGYIHGNGDAGYLPQTSDSMMRHQYQNAPGPSNADEPNNRLVDPDIAELYYRSHMQEEEILLLRRQINDACMKELDLLNEKHILERRLCELRIALDEKQDDAISSALKELTKKRSYFEENLRLANELKIVEEEMYILNSSLLSLLAEYDIRPHLISSSAISYCIKQLYQHMQWKIRTYEPLIPELRLYDQYPVNLPGKIVSNEKMDMMDSNIPQNPDIYREVGGTSAPGYFDQYGPEVPFRPSNTDARFYMGTMPDNQVSLASEGGMDLPGIDSFQIYGDALPGCKLQAAGYPTNGTTLCIFQWIRELDNGTMQYIEGATVPDYVVTADDVDTILAVECTPIDDSGHQGDLVRQFANNQNKIACDPEMQHEIDSYISTGMAEFTVKLWMDAPDWEQTTLILKRSNYLIKFKKTDRVVVDEKYSPELKVCIMKVPLGCTTQFVLTCSDGTNLPLCTDDCGQPFNVENDVRLRDIIVLTMRYFQSKALDAKRKLKA